MASHEKTLIRDLVLIGGGHAHIQTLKHFAQYPVAGLRIILVSDTTHAPYSGMLAGHLLGHYTLDDLHFDLKDICDKSGFQFVHAKVTGLDSKKKLIHFDDRSALPYDVASINVGIKPEPPFSTDDERVVLVKPISQFIIRLKEALRKCASENTPLRVAVIGGGAAGLELTLALNTLLKRNNLKSSVALYEANERVTPGFSENFSKRALKALNTAGVTVHLNSRVETLNALKADLCLISTQASAPRWLKQSGLSVDPSGFLKTQKTLQVLGEEDLFAAGDCIQFADKHLPRAGVYAVRQGETLTHNLFRHVFDQKPLQEYQPQKRALYLVSLGGKKVLAAYGAWTMQGAWLWWLKDSIDRRFMRQFKG